MAREYGFTQQEKDTYYLGKRVYSSWGRDDDNDYIAAFVYSVPGDVLLKRLYIPREDVSFSNEEMIKKIEEQGLKPDNQELKDYGLEELIEK